MVYLDIDFPVLTVFQAIYGLSLTVTACWWWCVPKLYILRTLKANLIQGPLIKDGRNSCKWTRPTVGWFKSFKRVKISGQIF